MKSPHICKNIRALKPGAIDATLIRGLVGDRAAKSLPEVARAFGFAHSTVKNHWRPAGMPGRPGCYPLADVLVWWLERDRARRGGGASDPVALRKARALADDAVARAKLRTMKVAKLRENLVYRDQVEREKREAYGLIHEALSAIPEQLVPVLTSTLPADRGKAIETEVGRMIDGALVALASRMGVDEDRETP